MTTYLSPLDPNDAIARQQAKAALDLREEQKRTKQEFQANEIFGKALRDTGWLPGGKKLIIDYERKGPGPNSQSLLTARCPTVFIFFN